MRSRKNETPCVTSLQRTNMGKKSDLFSQKGFRTSPVLIMEKLYVSYNGAMMHTVYFKYLEIPCKVWFPMMSMRNRTTSIMIMLMVPVPILMTLIWWECIAIKSSRNSVKVFRLCLGWFVMKKDGTYLSLSHPTQQPKHCSTLMIAWLVDVNPSGNGWFNYPKKPWCKGLLPRKTGENLPMVTQTLTTKHSVTWQLLTLNVISKPFQSYASRSVLSAGLSNSSLTKLLAITQNRPRFNHLLVLSWWMRLLLPGHRYT